MKAHKRDKVVEIRDACCARMAVRDRLHGSQPRKRHEIRKGLHSNVGIQKKMQLQAGNMLGIAVHENKCDS